MRNKKNIYIISLCSTFLLIISYFLLTKKKSEKVTTAQEINKQSEIVKNYFDLNTQKKINLKRNEKLYFKDGVHLQVSDFGPELVLGQRLIRNNLEGTNYLSIDNRIVFVQDSRSIEIKNIGCKRKEVVGNDHGLIRISECEFDIKTDVNKVNSFLKKTFAFQESTELSGGKTISRNPFIYIKTPALSFVNTKDDKVFEIISSFGTSKFKINMTEIRSGITKRVTMGPSELSVTPKLKGNISESQADSLADYYYDIIYSQDTPPEGYYFVIVDYER